MNERIEAYVDDLFKQAPPKRRIADIKEELLSNMNAKYDDLLARGKSENDAFTDVVGGIGDINGLIDFVLHEDGEGKAPSARKISHLLYAIAVALYILAVPVLIVLSSAGFEVLSVTMMFVLAAVATGLCVYASGLDKQKYEKEDDSFVEEYKEKISMPDRQSRLRKAASSLLWTTALIAYFLISFLTQAWHVTWVVFLICAVVQQVLLAILNGSKPALTNGVIWTSAVIVYFAMSFTLNNWGISWLVFIFAVFAQQGVHLVRVWREK